MPDKLMYITDDDTQKIPSIDYNQWLKRLDTQLNIPTIKNKVAMQGIRKH